jgi:hypothetical protein
MKPGSSYFDGISLRGPTGLAEGEGKQLRRYKLDEGLTTESMRWEDDETVSFEDDSGGRWRLDLKSGAAVAPEEDEDSVD